MYPDVIGGAEIFAYMLSKDLFKHGYEVCIIARKGSRFVSGIFYGISHYAYRSVNIPNKLISGYFQLFRSFIHLAKLKPDVCLGIMFGAALPCYMYSLITGKPSIIRLSGHDFRMIRSVHILRKRSRELVYHTYSTVYSILFWIIFTVVKNRVHFVALNKEMYNGLLEMGVKSKQIHLIFNPIDEIFFKVNPDVGAPKLVYVGRLVKEKSVEILVKAISMVIKESSDVKLIIIGDGPERTYMEDLVKSLGLSGNIKFEGFVPYHKVPQYLAESSVFILPSRAEGTPNALLQAMAAGLPIIATKVGGIPELVKDRVEGFLIPPNDVHSLAKAIITLTTDRELAKKFGSNARKKAEMFRTENIVKEYVKLLNAVSKKK